ncbi:dihydrofolate reductase family protein [Dietzia cinnamea]|uniref:Riboflavin biosynthesis pyrimidine reductase n=2 Tax=Dietzia TaxID=37914 RepID=A0A4R3ZYV1_9ACTN|nr:dihydrofolate reductase family protein [Dietzia cinnamea]MBC7307838.1 dihydrofolate reductase family protein [Dietzia sp.]TCW26201.1 riboflavin biosynthesis pyrimidine reductase [Dietzia cinnamea]
MHTTRLTVIDEDPAGLDALWEALEPEPDLALPRIRAVMISTVDGSTTVDGRSGGLGTPTDRLVYDAMRARADLVMVGSATALTEGYGPAGIADAWADRRPGPPPVVLVFSRSIPDRLIEHCAPLGDAVQVVAAHGVPGDRLEAARRQGVTVHVLDPGPLRAAVRSLATHFGASEVALEGGPGLLGTFLREGAVDELVLSVTPQLVVGGDRTPLASGPGTSRVPMRVAAAFTCPRGGLYTRWVVDGAAG